MSAPMVVNQFITAMEGMRFEDAFGLLAEDGKYIVIGTTRVSRTYEGKQDLFENLLPVLSTFKRFPVLRFEEPIVCDDRAVMLASGEGEGPTGPYSQPFYAFVARIKGREFSEVIEFMDTEMLQTAVFGKQLVSRLDGES